MAFGNETAAALECTRQPLRHTAHRSQHIAPLRLSCIDEHGSITQAHPPHYYVPTACAHRDDGIHDACINRTAHRQGMQRALAPLPPPRAATLHTAASATPSRRAETSGTSTSTSRMMSTTIHTHTHHGREGGGGRRAHRAARLKCGRGALGAATSSWRPPSCAASPRRRPRRQARRRRPRQSCRACRRRP